MSRIGNKPVKIPSGVKVNLSGQGVNVEGPLGRISWSCHGSVRLSVDSGQVTVTRADDTPRSRAVHGTTRQLIQNMLHGVSKGFEKNLNIEGVGYNAKVEKNALVLAIGFCTPIRLTIPAGLQVATPKPTIISVKGVDKQMVGQFSAQVRGARPPEPYKGKGIRYEKEVIRRKTAKSFSSA